MGQKLNRAGRAGQRLAVGGGNVVGVFDGFVLANVRLRGLTGAYAYVEAQTVRVGLDKVFTHTGEDLVGKIVALSCKIQNEVGDFYVVARRCEVKDRVPSDYGHLDCQVNTVPGSIGRRQGSKTKDGPEGE